MEFLPNNNWHLHQNDPDNWINIPDFDVLPLDVNFKGFEYPIMGPTNNESWKVRYFVWEIVKAVRTQAKKRFKSITDLKIAHISMIDRVGIFDKDFTIETYSDDELFAYRYHSIFYSLNRCLQLYKSDINTSIGALASAGADLAEMMIEKPIDGETMRKIRSGIGRSGANAKLAADPKQKAKALIRECWDDWQKDPVRYKSKAAFARDMRDKFPNLESQPVIEGWCRLWERKT